ncbi:LpxI family protein [Celeribacter ethanolicus]|uniref:LpxI family protein n=1 Tax=Celeribacter ethanolicus TaxID=1758178 RepID=UPI00082BA6CF|nr:UDP-2,3-diacylglucosamine diphosphatase LpxI [Celeribacter ethanolicus]
MTRTAIIAGSGALPRLLAEALNEPVYVTLDETAVPEGIDHVTARIEKLGKLFKELKSHDVGAVVFAGAMARPKINPMKLDHHAFRLARKLGKGDDALLREVLALFEDQGFLIRAATEIRPDLLLAPDTLWGRKPSREDLDDAARAQEVLDALSPLDVGQGAVCAGGQMLGIETVQGTDAMLSFVGATPERLRRARGVFVKAPKRGQDLRIDMPTIGIETVEKLISAGIGGIVVPAGGVIVLEQERIKARIKEAGLFLKAQ